RAQRKSGRGSKDAGHDHGGGAGRSWKTARQLADLDRVFYDAVVRVEVTMQASWTITPEKIDAAIKRIVSVAHPRKVILFGSVVAGKPDIHSDVDILVVTRDEIESSREESVRIRRALRGITMPMDI